MFKNVPFRPNALAVIAVLLLHSCHSPQGSSYQEPIVAGGIEPLSRAKAKVLSASIEKSNGQKMCSIPELFNRLDLVGYEKFLDGKMRKGEAKLDLSNEYSLSLGVDFIGGTAPSGVAQELNLGPHGELSDGYWKQATWLVRECRLLRRSQKANNLLSAAEYH